MKIQGEYWIIDGRAEFADGDLGDKNHETYALEHVCSKNLNSIYEYAKQVGAKNLPNIYSMEEESINSIKMLFNLLQNNFNKTYSEIEKKCGFDRETTLLMLQNSKQDPRLYVMKREGWVAVRNNNIELFELNQNKIQDLYNGLNEIIDQEADWSGDDEIKEEEIEFNLFDHKTKKSIDLTLQEIKERKFFRPNTVPQTTYNKSLPALKGKQYGRELWRGTSENKFNISFKNYIEEISLYHGTRSTFEKLEPRKARMGTGISFSTNPEIAYNYAMGKYKGGKSSGDPKVRKAKYDGLSFNFEKPVPDSLASFVVEKLQKYLDDFSDKKRNVFLKKIHSDWRVNGEKFYKEIQKSFAKRGTQDECRISRSRNQKTNFCEKCQAFDLMPDLLNSILLEAGYDSICYMDFNDNISHQCYFILDKSKLSEVSSF